MPPESSRSVLAVLTVAALLLTAGCLAGTSGVNDATPTDEPTTPTDEPATETDEPATETDVATDALTATDVPTVATDTPIATATATDEPVATGTRSAASDADASTAAGTPTPTPEATDASPGSDGPTAAEVLSAYESRMSSLESYTATRVRLTDLGNRSVNSTAGIWVRPGTGEYRTETLAPAERAGTTVIGGTETVWIVTDGNVTKFDRQSRAGTVAPTMAGQLTGGFEATAVESATVDGTETYRLTLEPGESRVADTTVVLHVDRETHFPVRIAQTLALEDSTMTTTVRYEDVRLNVSIPDGMFTYEPDDGEAVEEIDLPETETYDSLPGMQNATDVAVPDPDVPEGFEFQQGVVTTGNTTSVSIQYADGSTSLSVSKISVENATGDGENVTVGDHEGRLQSLGDVTSVSWSCGEWTYSVTGDLDREALLATAESIECA